MSFLTSRLPTLPLSPLTHAPVLPTSTLLTRALSTTTPQRAARMTIVGRLADTPELVPTSTGQEVLRYAVGTHHGPRDNRTTSWWRVAGFIGEGKSRDVLMGLGKGSLLYVEGDCSMNKFTDKEGKPQSALNIVQRSFEVLEKRGGEEGRAGEEEGEASE